MTPYMSLVLKTIVEVLDSYNLAREVNQDLWYYSLDLLHKSLTYDEGGK